MSIKITRAKRLSKIGIHDASVSALLDHIPESLIKRVTASELASIIDALWSCANASKAIADREACETSVVWAARHNAFRLVGPIVGDKK